MSAHLLAQNWIQAVREGDIAKVQEGLALGISPNGILPVLRFTPLYSACQEGQTALAKLLLKHGANTELGHPATGTTPLVAAIQAGKKDIVELLCKAHAHIDAVDHGGRTALMWSIETRRMDMVNLLLNEGADPNFQGPHSTVPLLLAVHQRSPEMVEMLLQQGARIDEVDLAQRTALMEAAHSGQHSLVARFIQAGARLDRPDIHGKTALILACEQGHASCVQVLLNAGANPNCADRAHQSALDVAFDGPHPASIVPLLLEEGAWFTRAGREGNTPLMKAVQARLLPVMEWMLDRGAETETVNEHGQTALHLAAEIGFLAGVHALLHDYGAVIGARDKHMNTPLHLASGMDVVDALLEAWADPFARNTFGETPVERLARKEQFEESLYLYRYGTALKEPEWNLLHAAIEGGGMELIHMLLDDGCSPEALNERNECAIEVAARYDRPHVGALLVQRGAHLHHPHTHRDLAGEGSEAFRFHIQQAWASVCATRLNDETPRSSPFTPRRRM